MNKTLCMLTLVATLAISAAAQDSRISPPVTMRENVQIVATHPGTEPVVKKNSSYEPPFCPPKTCLYYAGDFNSDYSDANGLFNANDEGGSLEGQVWVGVKPDRDVTVTGATFVELPVAVDITNPTPFVVQEGITVGKAGKTVCSTSGTAYVTAYQQIASELDYAFTIQTLSKPCKLRKGRVYYVNLLPIFSDGYAYVMNTPPHRPLNHHGWKNDLNDCYFNGAAFGANYVACDSQGIGNQGFAELEIALTGKKGK